MNLITTWKRVSEIGIDKIEDPLEANSLILTNRLSLIAIPVIFTISLILAARQLNAEPVFIFLCSIFFIGIPILNAYGFSDFGRLLMCFALPSIVLGMSIISKTIPGEEITNSEYFDYRYVLIATSALPPIIFNAKRLLLIIAGICPFFIGLVFFDPLHNLFNVGFYEINHDIDSYSTTTWISTLMFIVLAIILFMLRRSSDNLQLKNTQLITDLEATKDVLWKQNNKIQAANDIIRKKNNQLNSKNDLLASEVEFATKELRESNEELIKHNNELKQFSYTVSHNLRGPVARILGLSDLISQDENDESAEDYLKLLRQSAKLLDSNIRDLGSIVDIRNDIFKVRQEISFESLLTDLKIAYQKELETFNVKLVTNFAVPSFVTVKPMIVSILDNLMSNAIKYRSYSRTPEIIIETFEQNGIVILNFEDNGIGIDMKAYGNDLFKLYKRFNTQTEGKGVGLYLVLKQVESIGGKISVESELDNFTRFSIHLDIPGEDMPQTLVEEDWGTIIYEASRELLSIYWKREISSQELKTIMNRAYESFRELKHQNWLIDIRKRGYMDMEARLWMYQEFLPLLFKKGLKRIGVVYSEKPDETTMKYYADNQAVFEKYDIQIYFNNSLDEVRRWLLENKYAAQSNTQW